MTTNSGEQTSGQALRVVIYDGTLALAECEELAREYRYRPPFGLTIEARWGGPAAGGIGWGGPEIAVYLVIGVAAAEVLRRLASDVYDVTRSFVVSAYRKIQRKAASRIYQPMAVVLHDDQSPLALAFVLEDGLSQDEVLLRLEQIARHWESELEKWRSRYEQRVRQCDAARLPIGQINLCWDEESGQWRECQPPPPEFRWYADERPPEHTP